MNRIKVGLNGFGRIGKTFARIALQNDLFDIVAINTRSSDPKKISSLLKNDYIYGDLPKNVISFKDSIKVEDKEINILQNESIENINWADFGVDVVVEATGAFLDKKDLQKHLSKEVKKVVLTAISKDDDIPHVVLGVNDKNFDFKNSSILSNCSCTTNCVALLYKILNDNFGIKSSFFTTAHAYTHKQVSLEDLSKLKSRQLEIIPASTGASKGIFRVITELSEKIKGMALRVPVPTVSFSDITAILEKPTTKENLNDIFKKMSITDMSGILGYEDSYKQSSDLSGSKYSCVFDSNYTEVFNETYVKITGWYDNEWGYSSRLVDLVNRLSDYI